MRIGIDASRAFGEEKTGTENYSFLMIKHLLELPEAKQHQWVLYTKKPLTEKFITPVENITIKIPYLWTQVGLAGRTWFDRLDVLWIPAHTLPVLRKPGLRTVVTIHGIEYEYLPAYENKLQRWYLPLSTKYAVHNASKIIAVSQFTSEQIIKRLGGNPNKISVVYEGVDYGTGKLISSKQNVLDKFGLKNKSYILFIGTIQPRKNISRLIEAFKRLNNKSIDLVLVGKIGWGYEQMPIDQDSNIKFLRYINDAERDLLLQNALAYIQPSITEGFGLPILEAFAAGVPVASSNGGALPEVVGKAGLLFDPLSVGEMTSQLNRLVDDKNIRNMLVKDGKLQLTRFSWKNAAKETYKILTENC